MESLRPFFAVTVWDAQEQHQGPHMPVAPLDNGRSESLLPHTAKLEP